MLSLKGWVAREAEVVDWLMRASPDPTTLWKQNGRHVRACVCVWVGGLCVCVCVRKPLDSEFGGLQALLLLGRSADVQEGTQRCFSGHSIEHAIRNLSQLRTRRTEAPKAQGKKEDQALPQNPICIGTLVA